ncbi:hypothetical protein [Hydrogenophaga taeniospiralis]|nr:hypothetical protein [Hydrogenophaga taeniospiralis]
MNKGVLVGGGLGLLLLAFLAGVWLSRPAPEPVPAAALPAAPQVRPPASGAPDAPAGLPASPAEAPAPSASPAPGGPGQGAEGSAPPWAVSSPQAQAGGPGAPALTREQRRQIRTQIRAKVNELLSKGPQLSLAETQGLLDDIEKLGQGQFDPRYFQVMRQMIQHSVQTQRLSAELNRIAQSTAPKDVARRQAILGELREIGDHMAKGAQTMQSYSRDLLAGQQKP